MLAQHARRTRLKSSEKGATLAEVVDARLSQHGVDMEKISWDAYRRDDGTWRIVATWPSGKANATGGLGARQGPPAGRRRRTTWRTTCAAAPSQRRPAPRPRGRARPRPDHGRATSRSTAGREPARPGRDPIRAGRDALLASLERPLGTPPAAQPEPLDRRPAGRLGRVRRRHAARCRAAARRPRRLFEDERDSGDGDPGRAVAGRAAPAPHRAPTPPAGRPRPAGQARPSWDDVLFGAAPAAKDA